VIEDSFGLAVVVVDDCFVVDVVVDVVFEVVIGVVADVIVVEAVVFVTIVKVTGGLEIPSIDAVMSVLPAATPEAIPG